MLQEDQAYRTLRQEYLHGANAPTAIVTSNEYVGLRVVQGCEVEGFDVPGDVAIVACGPGDVSVHARVPLTTIVQSVSEIGRQAASLLLARIEGRTSTVRQITVPVSMIIRNSCGATPRATPLAVSRPA
jgi:LacI family transcriptional regulator